MAELVRDKGASLALSSTRAAAAVVLSSVAKRKRSRMFLDATKDGMDFVLVFGSRENVFVDW